jgi:uncharacterized protein GlcG (DUF336 family)
MLTKTNGRCDKMKKQLAGMLAVGVMLSTSMAQAQVTFVTPDNNQLRAPRPARDRGPALDAAVLAAQTAVKACEAQGFKVSAVVVDSVAMPVVLLSGDGAALITQTIGMGKAVSSAKNNMASGDLAKAAQTDTALAAKLAADPQEGPQRPGGLPIKDGGVLIGAIAVSGTPSGVTDAGCAQAGIDKVNADLKHW